MEALHIGVLFAFAVSQPIYDLLGSNPTFFIFHRFGAVELLAFVLLFSLLAPLLWFCLISLTGSRGRRYAMPASSAVLVTAIVLPWLGRLEALDAGLATALSLAAGAIFALLWMTRPAISRLLTWLSPVIVLFAALFLLRPEIRALWRAPSVAVGELETGANQPPIVLVVFDALPTTSLLDGDYTIDSVRYPAFARLARESSWYRMASTVSLHTVTAVPAIVAGRCLDELKPPTFSTYPQNLFTLLGGSYDLHVSELMTQLCPPKLCSELVAPWSERLPPLLSDTAMIFAHRLLPPAWSAQLPPVDTTWGAFGNRPEDLVKPRQGPLRIGGGARFREFIAGIEPRSSPTLHFTHLMLPHPPFYYLPSGTQYRTESKEPAGSWQMLGDDPWVAAHSYQRHLLQLGFVDLLLGELLAKLDATGLYEQSLVIVTADHGTSFQPNQPRRELGASNAVNVLGVPLFVKLPGQQTGTVSDGSVQTADILALVADALGRTPPPWSDGSWPSSSSAHADGRPSCRELLSEVPDLDGRWPEMTSAVDHKLSLFGSGETAGSVPAAGPRPDLLGLPAQTEGCQPLPDLAIELSAPELFHDVHPKQFVPAEVVGVVHGAAAREVDLAIAVNGIVRATTHAYTLGARETSLFAAILPEDAFRRGQNSVQLLAAGARDTSCPLRPIGEPSAAPSSLDSRLGVWPIPYVEERGFNSTDSTGSGMIRWTRGRGFLSVPLSWQQSAQVQRIRIEIGAVAVPNMTLKVRVNRRTVVDQPLEKLPWTGTFDLPDLEPGEPLQIRLQSDHVLFGNRKHGVGVTGIWLLSRQPAPDGG